MTQSIIDQPANPGTRTIETDVLIIGGGVTYTTGYLDLLGAVEGSSGVVDNPWDGLELLKKTHPDHPLSHISAQDIREGFRQFTAFLGECGIAYTGPRP